MFNIPEWDAVHSRGERRWQGGEKGGREERESCFTVIIL